MSRLKGKMRQLESNLRNLDLIAKCYLKPIEKLTDVSWPAVEIAVIYEIDSLETFSMSLEIVIQQAKEQFADNWRYSVVPRLKGCVIGEIAMRPMQSGTIYPDLDFKEQWAGQKNLNFCDPNISTVFEEAMSACFQLSAIILERDINALKPDEFSLTEELYKSYETSLESLGVAFDETDHEVIGWAWKFAHDAGERVENEKEAKLREEPIELPLCGEQYSIFQGQGTDYINEMGAGKIALIIAEIEGFPINQNSLN